MIPEGLNGRTTVWDDPIEEYRCGKQQIIPCLDMHDPLDLVIIMIGSNDLKRRYTVSAQDIANGAGLILERTLQHSCCFRDEKPKVLFMCPPPLGDISKGIFKYEFGGGEEKSHQLHTHYERVAEKYGVPYLNAGAYVHSSERDGAHLEADQHAILGKVVAEKVREIL